MLNETSTLGLRKVLSLLFIILFIANNFLVFSLNEIVENHMYFLDTNNNNKIDRLEIEFNNELTGSLNPDKLFLYSDTGGLASSKLDSVSGNSIFSSSSLSGNILILNLAEQDNAFTGLVVNNTTSSHLRIKTNAGVGIKDLSGNEIKLLYTSSFANYVNVSFKQNQITEIISESPEIVVDTTNEEIINPDIVEEATEGTNTGTTEEISTGTSLSETGTIDPILTNFQTKILFQSPSYLLERDDSEATIFNCDSAKTDCKVNYNLNLDYGSGFVSIPSDYECQWNFGFSGTTGEESKCNPNTIVYPVGEYEATYKVQEKANPLNYDIKKLKIINGGYKEIITTQTVYISSSSQTQTNISNQLNIASPKIIVQSGLDENNNCKNTECSINLNYETKNSKEACLWTFGNADYEEETKYKCNPGYARYGIGDFKVTLKVYELGNETNYKETSLNFSNKEKKVEEINKIEEIKAPEIIEEFVDMDKDEIIGNKTFSGNLEFAEILPNVVGTDDNEWFEIRNAGEEKTNLKGCEIRTGSKKYSLKDDLFIDENGVYRFYKGETKLSIKNTGGTKLELFCDGSEIDSISWKFDTPEGFIVSADIASASSIEEGDEEGVFVLTFPDGTIKEIAKAQELSLPQLLSSSNEIISNNLVKAIIEIQGKLGENKKLARNKLTCIDTDVCSINFDGRSSKGAKDMIYLWDFGNGKTFDKPNPASYKFVEGKHIISLSVFSAGLSDTTYFSIEVLAKESKKKIEKEDEILEKTDSDFIKTRDASSNAKSENSSQNINKLAYIGVLLSMALGLLGFILKKRGLL